MAGVVAAFLGLVWAVHVAGILTALSGLLAWAQMSETLTRMGTDTAALGTGPPRGFCDTSDTLILRGLQ